MAKLRSTFLKGVETVFKTFEESVHTGAYSLPVDNGFDPVSFVDDTIRCIFENARERDVELLTFSKLIQPMDVMGLVPYVDFVNNTKVTSQAECTFDNVKYKVVAHDLDPMRVLYTILFRKN